jgi:hypothetical protein
MPTALSLVLATDTEGAGSAFAGGGRYWLNVWSMASTAVPNFGSLENRRLIGSQFGSAQPRLAFLHFTKAAYTASE